MIPFDFLDTWEADRVVSKATDYSAGARGLEYENLPFGFGGGPGPSAWRNVQSPLDRIAAADIKAESISALIRQMQSGKRLSKKQMRRLIDQYQIAEQMAER